MAEVHMIYRHINFDMVVTVTSIEDGIVHYKDRFQNKFWKPIAEFEAHFSHV